MAFKVYFFSHSVPPVISFLQLPFFLLSHVNVSVKEALDEAPELKGIVRGALKERAVSKYGDPT